MLNIIVLVKRVPDAASRIEIDGARDIKSDAGHILNPYDEFAVEEALRVKERFGAAVTVVTAGTADGEGTLKKCVAMGADSAVYIRDGRLAGASAMTVASALAAFISKTPFDLVLAGRVATDDSAGTVGPAVAGFLDIPFVTAVKKLELDLKGKKAVAHSETDLGTEVVECALPALFTATRGLNEPRYLSLANIMKSKKIEITCVDMASLEPLPGARPGGGVGRVSLSYPLIKRKNVLFKGEAAWQVKEAVKILKDEVKLI